MDFLKWSEPEQNQDLHSEIYYAGHSLLGVERKKPTKTWERSSPSEVLIKRLDKTMRNKFTVIRRREDKDMEGGMIAWFESRLNN